MSDSVVKLTINSQEYDEKLKRATDSLQRYVDGCRKVGGTLEVVEEETLDFVKALGSMETQCRNANGRLSEMKKSFTDWSMIYKNLTDEEKSSPFGKNLAASIDQLKGRIADAKKDLADVNKELGETGKESQSTGNFLDQLAGKFGLSAKQLTTWGAALGAGKVALDTMKGAIESTETGHDALARTISITDSVTNQFLRTLSTADFSTFMNGLQGIINKATEAYNTLDEFESYAARFNPYQQAKESEIQTKLMQARAAKAQGDKEKAERLTNEAKSLIDQLAASTKAYGEKQTKSGFASIRNLMGGVEISDQQIAWYADPKNWEQAKEKADKYEKTLSRIQYLSKEISTGRRPGETDAGVSVRHFSAREELKRLQQELKSDPSLKRAYTMQNLRDSGDSDQAQQLRRALGDIYGNTLAQSHIESLRARADRIDGVIARSGSTGGTGSQLTDPEKAQQKYEQALRDYNQALEQAALETKAGTVSTVDAKKKELSAEETLWKAIGDAREIYDTDQLKQEQDKVAAKVVELGGSVNALVEEQKAAQEAARELAAAEKKVSAALEEAANAYDANDLKGYIQAMNRVGGDVSAGMRSGNFSYTQSNLSAFTAHLKEELSNADVGSELFNALTAQIADAQTLANLMETAVKNGVEIAEFEPQELFNKIFGDTPGDYIDNIDWQAIQDAINEKLKEMDLAPIELNFQTGDIKKDNEKSENATKDFKSLIGNVSTITGALKQIGVDVPEGFAKTLGVMQVITTILMAIQSLSTITATTSALKSIPIIGWFLQQGGVIHAQEGFNGIVPGNMFTGDNIPALLNSGETVLTAAQSASVANLLTSGGGEAAGASETRVESDELVLTIRNGAARRGMTMGEYLGL